MRLLVVLAAIVFKYWLASRMMTPRNAIILRIAAFALVALMMTIMGMRQNEKHQPAEPYCSDKAQEHLVEERCEFKLRRAFGSFRPYEARIA